MIINLEIGNKLRILNAKRLECDDYWVDGTIVEVFEIDPVDRRIMVTKKDDFSYKVHEIYENELMYVELVHESKSKEEIRKYKVGDMIEFISVENIIGDAKNYFKNGDIAEISRVTKDSIKVRAFKDSKVTFVLILEPYFKYIMPFTKPVIHKDSREMASKILGELDEQSIELRKNFLLEHRRFDEIKLLIDELNKRGGDDE